jgi:AraC-like DNA-binding protein
MQHFLLLVLIFISSLSFGQTWKDQKTEKLFLENNFIDAKKYIESKLNTERSLSIEETIYLQSKLSHSYLRTGDFEKALQYAKKATVSSKLTKDKLVLSESWRAMAFAYLRKSELDSAMVYSEKMYHYGKETNNYDFTRAAVMAMGNISMQLEKYQNAVNLYSDVLQLTEKNQNASSNLKVDYYNLGLAYSRLKQIEKSNALLELAAQRTEKENDEILLGRIYGSLLDNYSKLNNNSKRLLYQDKANKIAEKKNNHQLLAMGYSNMMEWSLNENNPTKAIEYGKLSLEKLKQFPIKQLEIRVDSMMYAALKTLKRNDEALSFLESFEKKKKKINSYKVQNNLNELVVKYDLENKNLKIKNQKNLLVIAQREKNIYLLLLISIAAILVSLIILKRNRIFYRKLLYNKEKYNEMLFTRTKHLLVLLNLSKNYIDENEKINDLETNSSKSELLFNKIIETIDNEKLFLNPELDQKSLIRILGTNKKYLYEAIKLHGESNFRGIINRLRVNYAKKMIENSIIEKHTMNFSELYAISGFNANSSFYRIFKSITGLSPAEYALEFKKDHKKNKTKNQVVLNHKLCK